jgi:hypothetical protein
MLPKAEASPFLLAASINFFRAILKEESAFSLTEF